MADQIYLNLWVEGFTKESMLGGWRKLLDEFPASLAQPGVRGVASIPFSWGEAPAFEQVFAEGATIESVVEAARDFLHADYAYQAAMRWDVWRQKTLEELAETDLEQLAGQEFADDEDGPELDEESDEESDDADGGAPAQSSNETLGWKRVPMEVSVICLGPEFDTDPSGDTGPDSGNPHFRIELGLDTLFLPDQDAAEPADEDDWEEAALCYRDNITQLLGYMRRIEKALPVKSRLLWSASGEDLGERIRQAYGGT